MRDIWKLTWRLLLIAAIAGLALGVTNALTMGPIKQQELLDANASRAEVLPVASEFALVAENEQGLDSVYEGIKDGVCVGFTAQITTTGYGGEIEVIVGMDNDGTITGIKVGGTKFAETPGLGAKTKEAPFTGQFANKEAPIVLGEDVMPVTAATRSSRAITNAVNDAASALSTFIG